jgi:non-ribosomal peptide synthetase component F
MPTTRPRYTVTDTGHTTELLDLAQRAWPEITDRRQLLLRLTEVGGEALEARLAEQEQRRERQRVGLERAARLVDVDALLGDQAWH